MRIEWKKDHGAALLLFGFALALRLYRLSALSLWIDEGGAWSIARCAPWDIVALCLQKEPHPPLYYLLLHAVIKVMGDSEFALRLPSALFGAGAAALTYLIGRRHFSARVGLLAGLFAACVPFQLRYSQEAREYALFGFCALLTTLWLPWELRWRSRAHRNGYLAAAVVLAYTHYYAVLLLFAQAAFIAWRSRRAPFLKSWLAVTAVVAALAAPLYGAVALHFRAFSEQVAWLNNAPPPDPFRAFEYYCGLASLALDAVPPRLPLLGVSAVALLAYCWVRFRSREKNPMAAYLALGILCLVALPFLYSALVQRYFALRYAVPAGFLMYLLAFAALEPLWERARAFRFALLATAGLCVFFVHDYFSRFAKQDWRGAVQAAEDPGIPLVAFPASYFYRPGVIDYYAARYRPSGRLVFADTVQDVDRAVREGGGAWLVWYAASKAHREKPLRALAGLEESDYRSFPLVELRLLKAPARP
jgi:mannosyltransferase